MLASNLNYISTGTFEQFSTEFPLCTVWEDEIFKPKNCLGCKYFNQRLSDIKLQGERETDCEREEQRRTERNKNKALV